LRCGRDVVNRDYQKILSRARCRDNRQKLRGHRRGHYGKFQPPSPANKPNLTGHLNDGLEVFGAERHHRKPRLAD
jgi:hypothetical protein